MSTAEIVATLPRLLADMPRRGAMSFQEHERVHGVMPAPGRSRHEHELQDELERAGLRGCGGASFPTAVKLAAVTAARGRPVVIANASEGEPASRKDRLLLEHLPHLVLDGALLAARAVRAREVIVAVDDHASAAARSVELALRERHDLGRTAPRVTVASVPRGYITGQESALVNVLAGGPPKPTATPPAVYERGLGGRPTLVDNAETLAHVALIARHGAAWFRQVGTTEAPGSRLVTLSGAVTYPGVFEIGDGTPLRSLIDAAGGTTEPVRAFLLGGYAGVWVSAAAQSTLMLSDPQLAPVGAMLGAGIVVALGSTACAVAETAHIASWMNQQSAGQCGPCINGLASIAATLAELQRGVAGEAAFERLSRWAALVRGRGACAHPDGVARFVTSALEVFAPEFADHARYGECEACARRRVLPEPGTSRRRIAA